MKKVLFLILFFGTSAFLIWLVWFRPVNAPEEEQKPDVEVPVHAGKISRATLRSYVMAYGIIEPEPTAAAHLVASIPGLITAVHCVEGQSVEKGALLFEQEARAAEVAVKFAEKGLERQKKLIQAESSSQKILQETEQQLALARAQLALLQVRAPISGVVAKVNVKVGEAADLTTVLAELLDLERLVLSVNIPSEDLASLKPGQAVEVTLPGSTNALNTSLAFISAQVDPKTDSAVVRAALPVNSGLRPGQFVKARIVTQERKDSLVVPLASVAKDTTGITTFIALIEGEKALLKPVKTGLREGDWVEVEGDGVELDKTVVTEGAYGLIMAQRISTTVRVVNE